MFARKSTYKLLLSLLFAPILFFALNSTAAAATFEYDVYGPPTIAYNAFNSLALWLSDSNWVGIVYGIIGLSILFGVLSGFLKSMATGRGNVITSVYLPFLAGLVIYAGFIRDTSNLQIVYEPTQTPYAAPINVPTGIAVMASMFSSIEDTIVNMIQTGGNSVMLPPGTVNTGVAPTITQDGYSWISFDMLNNIVNGNIGSAFQGDPVTTANLRQYIVDCLTPSILNYTNNGQGTDPQSLMQLTQPGGWSNVLSSAANPAIYTTYYTGTSANSVTCQADWTNLSPKLNQYYSGSIQNQINYVLQAEGFDTSNSQIGVQMGQAGQNALTSQYNYITGQNASAAQLTTDLTIANMVRDVVLRSGNQAFTTMTNYNNINSSIGTFSSLNYYLPTVKVFVLAIIVGVTGLLMMLIPTPFVGRAIEAIFGLWLWYTLWIVSDVLVSVISTNAALSYLIGFKNYGTGLMALYQGSGELSKILGLIGTFRGLGIGLAGVLAGIITRSSAALVGEMVAGHLQGNITSSGAAIAQKTETVQGRAETVSQMQNAAPELTFANQHSFMNVASAYTNNMSRSYGAGRGFGSGLQGSTNAETTGEIQTQDTVGTTRGLQNAAVANGQTVTGFTEQKSYLSNLQQIGQLDGAYNGYQNYEQGYKQIHNGSTKGMLSFQQWIGQQSQYQHTNLSTQAQAMQELANQYFGGDLNKEMNFLNTIKSEEQVGGAFGTQQALQAYEANGGQGGLVGMTAFNKNLGLQMQTAGNQALQNNANKLGLTPYEMQYQIATGQQLKQWAGSKAFMRQAEDLGIPAIIAGETNNMIATTEKGVTMGSPKDAANIGAMQAYALKGELEGLGNNPSNAAFVAATDYAQKLAYAGAIGGPAGGAMIGNEKGQYDKGYYEKMGSMAGELGRFTADKLISQDTAERLIQEGRGDPTLTQSLVYNDLNARMQNLTPSLKNAVIANDPGIIARNQQDANFVGAIIGSKNPATQGLKNSMVQNIAETESKIHSIQMANKLEHDIKAGIDVGGLLKVLNLSASSSKQQMLQAVQHKFEPEYTKNLMNYVNSHPNMTAEQLVHGSNVIADQTATELLQSGSGKIVGGKALGAVGKVEQFAMQSDNKSVYVTPMGNDNFMINAHNNQALYSEAKNLGAKEGPMNDLFINKAQLQELSQKGYLYADNPSLHAPNSVKQILTPRPAWENSQSHSSQSSSAGVNNVTHVTNQNTTNINQVRPQKQKPEKEKEPDVNDRFANKETATRELPPEQT